MQESDENWVNHKNINHANINHGNDTIEKFCGACLAVPLAFAGVGSAAFGSSGSKKSHKTQKRVALWIGIVTVVISLLIAIYYIWISKCTNCR